MIEYRLDAILSIICQKRRVSIKRKVTYPEFFLVDQFAPYLIAKLIVKGWVIAKGPNWIPTEAGKARIAERNAAQERTVALELPFKGYHTYDQTMAYGLRD